MSLSQRKGSSEKKGKLRNANGSDTKYNGYWEESVGFGN